MIQRDPRAAGHVDRLARGRRRLARAQHAVDDVGDVGEVAGLFAVAVDGRAAPRDQRGGKKGDHAGVGRARILARSEHVEVADHHRLEAVEAVKHLTVLAPHRLLQRVGRQRARRHVFGFWQRRRVAVFRG